MRLNRRRLRITLLGVSVLTVLALVSAGQDRLLGRREPTARDVPYGPHPRQMLDFWQAQSDQPTPVLVYFHGGGFVGGSKGSIDERMLRWALDDGISVVAVNYRYVTTDPFPAPMRDGARALQFLRSKHQPWNLDPARFAVYGGSAGAGISMWLGFHDDLADPASADLVERESSRVVAIGSFGGQTTYDPTLIRDWIGGRAWQHPSLLLCYDMQSLADVDDPQFKPRFHEASAISHLTADDPPIYMAYAEPDGPLPPNAKPGQGIHHPRFGRELQSRMEALGIPCVNVHVDPSQRGEVSREMYEFLRGRLQPAPSPTP